VFFGEPPAETAIARAAPSLPWLRDVVRTTLQLPEDEAVDARSLPDLGMESLHAVALQYQILEEAGIDVAIDDLFAARDVAALADLLGQRTTAEPVPEGVPG
jgi:acyl carrier protein